jgi:hypothetical protein
MIPSVERHRGQLEDLSELPQLELVLRRWESMWDYIGLTNRLRITSVEKMTLSQQPRAFRFKQ